MTTTTGIKDAREAICDANNSGTRQEIVNLARELAMKEFLYLEPEEPKQNLSEMRLDPIGAWQTNRAQAQR